MKDLTPDSLHLACGAVVLSLVLLSGGALAADGESPPGPTVGEVRNVCERALVAGYRGVEAAACDWYLDPCEVCGPDSAEPRWCVPSALAPDVRVRRVLDALTGDERPAAPAIAEVLERLFPCPASDRG